MKRMTLAVIAFIALLSCTAPLVLAEDGPNGPPPDTGGCSGPNCK
jgi:hypothetical protein